MKRSKLLINLKGYKITSFLYSRMKYQKMPNLLDETKKTASKCVIENWIEIDNKIKIKTIVIDTFQ